MFQKNHFYARKFIDVLKPWILLHRLQRGQNLSIYGPPPTQTPSPRAQTNLENLEKQYFLWHSGKTWKTQGMLRKYFKLMEKSGNSVQIDFQLILYFLATIYFEWCCLFFTLNATVLAEVLLTYLVGLSDWLMFEMTCSGCTF